MAADIISSLQLDTEYQNKVIAVKEINQCDSSFITSCILSYCIKNNNAVIIVSNHNTSSHYHQVGLKMNYNLQKQMEAGVVSFYNLDENMVKNVLQNEKDSLQNVFYELRDKVNNIQKQFETVNIIVEGISHLFDLDYTLRNVNDLCNNLIKLSRSMNSAFVIFLCNVACEDDVTHVMSNLLSHKADTVIEVENLPSGWSNDVSGHMIVRYPGRKFEDAFMHSLEQKTVKYLFKLFDRGVKLFAPGTV